MFLREFLIQFLLREILSSPFFFVCVCVPIASWLMPKKIEWGITEDFKTMNYVSAVSL